MFTPCRVWTVLLLGFCFIHGSWGILASTLELITVPRGVSLTLESPSCLACRSFLELHHIPLDTLATVITTKPLDADIVTEYNGFFPYSIVCLNSGIINNRTLGLKDINDNAPVFEKDVYSVEVSQLLPVGSLVVKVKAIDADVTPVYNTVTYNINPPSDTFEVTADGSVVLKKPLNFAMTSFYSFNMTAKDIDSLSGTTTVIVSDEIDTRDVVEIYINQPFNVVKNKVHETERALEMGLELLVKIRDVSRGRQSNAVVSFIARQTNGTIVPPEDVKSNLKNNKQRIRTELQRVLGPKADFGIVEGLDYNLVLYVNLGVVIPFICIGGAAFVFIRVRSRERSRPEAERRASVDSMDAAVHF
ncbi:hypothetical protein ACEWY4_017552 [Coilia grayii]|uniref:Cadherin domain-containing protein n=1 Tax=Coilia grayii TaxID=363190 RepID=A0ABD1JKM2_9TELE